MVLCLVTLTLRCWFLFESNNHVSLYICVLINLVLALTQYCWQVSGWIAYESMHLYIAKSGMYVCSGTLPCCWFVQQLSGSVQSASLCGFALLTLVWWPCISGMFGRFLVQSRIIVCVVFHHWLWSDDPVFLVCLAGFWFSPECQFVWFCATNFGLMTLYF